MNEPLLQHPRTHFSLEQQVDRALLEDAGANAPGDIIAALPFHDDIVDAIQIQELRKEKARGTRADDCDLSARHDAHPMRVARSLAAANLAHVYEINACRYFYVNLAPSKFHWRDADMTAKKT